MTPALIDDTTLYAVLAPFAAAVVAVVPVSGRCGPGTLRSLALPGRKHRAPIAKIAFLDVLVHGTVPA